MQQVKSQSPNQGRRIYDEAIADIWRERVLIVKKCPNMDRLAVVQNTAKIRLYVAITYHRWRNGRSCCLPIYHPRSSKYEYVHMCVRFEPSSLRENDY